jgi:Tfp pilus assembly protein PilN
MRAVNLIPEGERKGAGGAAGKSGGAAYVLLGALALFVVMAAAYTLSGKSVDEKKADLARVSQQADAAQARAAQLSAYTRFTDLRTKRVQTVSQLAQSRFDWAHALREVARVIPENAWLTQLVGTVTTGVNTSGGGTGAGALRNALPVPAIEISGCTTSQSSVAKVLARLRMIDGVQRVSLADSVKADVDGIGGGGSGGGAGGADCRAGNSRFPLFNAVVFFEARPSAAAPATGATGSATTASTTPGSGTSQTAAQTSTTPAPTTTTPSTTTSTTPSSTTQPASGGSTP